MAKRTKIVGGYITRNTKRKSRVKRLNRTSRTRRKRTLRKRTRRKRTLRKRTRRKTPRQKKLLRGGAHDSVSNETLRDEEARIVAELEAIGVSSEDVAMIGREQEVDMRSKRQFIDNHNPDKESEQGPDQEAEPEQDPALILSQKYTEGMEIEDPIYAIRKSNSVGTISGHGRQIDGEFTIVPEYMDFYLYSSAGENISGVKSISSNRGHDNSYIGLNPDSLDFISALHKRAEGCDSYIKILETQVSETLAALARQVTETGLYKRPDVDLSTEEGRGKIREMFVLTDAESRDYKEQESKLLTYISEYFYPYPPTFHVEGSVPPKVKLHLYLYGIDEFNRVIRSIRNPAPDDYLREYKAGSLIPDYSLNFDVKWADGVWQHGGILTGDINEFVNRPTVFFESGHTIDKVLAHHDESYITKEVIKQKGSFRLSELFKIISEKEGPKPSKWVGSFCRGGKPFGIDDLKGCATVGYEPLPEDFFAAKISSKHPEILMREKSLSSNVRMQNFRGMMEYVRDHEDTPGPTREYLDRVLDRFESISLSTVCFILQQHAEMNKGYQGPDPPLPPGWGDGNLENGKEYWWSNHKGKDTIVFNKPKVSPEGYQAPERWWPLPPGWMYGTYGGGLDFWKSTNPEGKNSFVFNKPKVSPEGWSDPF